MQWRVSVTSECGGRVSGRVSERAVSGRVSVVVECGECGECSEREIVVKERAEWVSAESE